MRFRDAVRLPVIASPRADFGREPARLNGDEREHRRDEHQALQPLHVLDLAAAQREYERQDNGEHDEAVLATFPAIT